MRKNLLVLSVAAVLSACCAGCTLKKTETDVRATLSLSEKLSALQPTPTDIDYSLERYNLIRRAYWVNGQRERANTLVCEVEKPLGYIVLFAGNAVAGKFVVDGKVSSLNSYLTPDSMYYEQRYGTNGASGGNAWLADVDGSYGENDAGIFFFTPDGKYVEYTGDYLYSDIPFEISGPTVTYEAKK